MLFLTKAAAQCHCVFITSWENLQGFVSRCGQSDRRWWRTGSSPRRCCSSGASARGTCRRALRSCLSGGSAWRPPASDTPSLWRRPPQLAPPGKRRHVISLPSAVLCPCLVWREERLRHPCAAKREDAFHARANGSAVSSGACNVLCKPCAKAAAGAGGEYAELTSLASCLIRLHRRAPLP